MKKMFFMAFCLGGTFAVFGQAQKTSAVKAAFSSEIPMEPTQIQYHPLKEPEKKIEKESSSTKLQPLNSQIVTEERKFRTREESETK